MKKKIILIVSIIAVALVGLFLLTGRARTDGKWIKTENKYDGYNLVSNLKSNDYASTEMLVKFDGVLYGKSYAIIDYAEPQENKIGTIDKLIDDKYVPKLNNETNNAKLLNAEVYNKTLDSIVLYYDNTYVLFGKIDE